MINIKRELEVAKKASETAAALLIDNKEKIFIIGAGSNTLISDNIFDGVVIKLSKNFNRISLLREDVIISGSGVLDNSLSSFAAENNLSGFEFFWVNLSFSREKIEGVSKTLIHKTLQLIPDFMLFGGI